ncbi:MAG: glycosyl hydrolase 53 family protein [Chitinispirillaceae bacterium]|nr:glycosyl hydrolase 53 family protein [Chitinispirillaceae bacterium]
MKRYVILTLFPVFIITVDSVEARSRQFVFGADISWVDADIDKGQKYYDGSQEKSIFYILKDHKFNCIRLRVFVDPSADVPGEQWDSPYSTKGYCGLERTIEFAKKIKEAGMMFSLDFHYSDTWADPSKQHKPMGWRNLSYGELVKKVRSYTRESLEACEKAGVLPDMVQVGNEIVGGMIWPDGRSGNMKQFAELVNAGIDGVKDVSEDIEIFIHSISDATPSKWFSNLINAGVDANRIDIFGLSYYEEWHGTPNDLKRNLTEITKNHDVMIAVAEYSEVHEQVNDIVFNLPDEEGIGTFVWEPTKWHETLFTNGRTNSRIDLYTKLWDRYGNDTLPLKPAKVSVNQYYSIATESSSGGSAWLDPAGIPRRGNSVIRNDYSIVNLQGRTVAAVKKSFTAGSVNPSARNMYIIHVSDDKEKQLRGRLLNRVR